MNKAIGLIEVKGYVTAILVADTVLKVAEIDVIGIQSAKGYGWMTVKITGAIGAVNAAIEAGKAKASANDGLLSALIIPRPADALDEFVLDTVDYPLQSNRDNALEYVNEQTSSNVEVQKIILPPEKLNDHIEADVDKSIKEEQIEGKKEIGKPEPQKAESKISTKSNKNRRL